ncbi:MAG: hypothetical protein HY867_06505 [Chloroflexi bacterium]|nr:hypothetical protein [Chloroflexota bacterium]
MQSTKPSQHIHGFDWVRAFMSVAAVMWHIRTFGKSLLLTEKFTRFQLNAIAVLNFNLALWRFPSSCSSRAISSSATHRTGRASANACGG